MKNLKKILLTGVITIAATFAMTIISSAANVKVTGEVVNIRKSPSTDASVVAMLSKGVECEYLGEEGDWYKIKYQRYTGYVSKQYVSLEGDTSNSEDTNKTDEKTDNKTNSKSDSKNDNQDSTDKNNNKDNDSNSDNKNSNQNNNNSKQNDDNTKSDEANSRPAETTKLTYKKFNQNTVIRILPLIFSSEIEGVKKDKEVLILAETSGWTYVQTDEISGWVRTDTLGESKTVEAGTTPTKTNEEETYTEKTGYVSEESVNLRKGPGTGSKVLKTLTLNTEVTITGEEGDWYKVKSGSIEGYILKEYVSDSKKVTSRSLSEPRKTTEEDKKEDNKDDKKATDKETNTTTTSNKDKNENKDNKTNKSDKNTTNKTTKKTGYINEEYVNIREGAGTNYKVLKVAKLNDEVTITGEEGDWYKVKSETTTGYILKEYVSDKKKTTTSKKDNNTTSDKKTNNSTNNNKNDNKTDTSNKTQTNTSNESSVRGSDIVAYAKKFLGRRYVYGGNGPNSFDCSGFTCYVFKHFGVSLPRTVSGQYYSGKGTKITKMSNLKVGDIVCFRDYSSGNAFGHCGIYIGGGQFIHASTTNYQVRISDLSGTYSNRFCGGLRVFK